jgi:hypothetical protein
MDADALSKVQLKATSGVDKRDRSAPNYTLALAGEVTSEKEDQRRQYFFSTGLDKWYSSLTGVTFPTEFLPIHPDEARAIIEHWSAHFKDRDSDNMDLPQHSYTIPSSLVDLSSRIDSAISKFPGNCAFIKLSTRSPKDSLIAFKKAQVMYDQAKHTLNTLNDKIILLQKCVIDSLKVENGDESVHLLISSTRVGEDLEYALVPDDAGFSERCSLVLRQWVDIPLWAEFRCFVWERKMTAIGQYNHPVVFKELMDDDLVRKIKTDLEQFFERIKCDIPIDRYIIDMAWTTDRVYLVEINPFDGEIVFPASTGLWDWEKDRDQMMQGPLDIRVRRDEVDPLVLKRSTDPIWRNSLFQ